MAGEPGRPQSGVQLDGPASSYIWEGKSWVKMVLENDGCDGILCPGLVIIPCTM